MKTSDGRRRGRRNRLLTDEVDESMLRRGLTEGEDEYEVNWGIKNREEYFICFQSDLMHFMVSTSEMGQMFSIAGRYPCKYVLGLFCFSYFNAEQLKKNTQFSQGKTRSWTLSCGQVSHAVYCVSLHSRKQQAITTRTGIYEASGQLTYIKNAKQILVSQRDSRKPVTRGL